MKYNEMKEIFNKNNEVTFKLYSLEYTIKKQDDKVIIYSLSDSFRKSYFSSFEDLLNNFNIYMEPLIENIDRIIIIKDKVQQ